VSFKELQYGLGKLGFREPNKLAALFKRVDADRNGLLNFTEFMALTFVFSVERGDLSCLFAFKENAKLVKDCFSLIDKLLVLYDKNQNGKLEREEVSFECSRAHQIRIRIARVLREFVVIVLVITPSTMEDFMYICFQTRRPYESANRSYIHTYIHAYNITISSMLR
jgi:hypothetical protein